jgi:ABC-type multidrug transport system ATPase subunit
MSSQHLEEADHLADRICIMTHGKILQLDTPHQIKKQFGVGFKIFIEPKNINLVKFHELKLNYIDKIILSRENIEAHIQ